MSKNFCNTNLKVSTQYDGVGNDDNCQGQSKGLINKIGSDRIA